MMITGLGLFQIVMKGDYLSEDDEEDVDDAVEDSGETTQEESFVRTSSLVLNESELRKIIRHTIIVQSRNTR